MQPEPAHRTTKKRKRAPNERPPICFRPGDLRAELDARCDGTEAGYRAVVVRDLQRYYDLVNNRASPWFHVGTARAEYTEWLRGDGRDEFADLDDVASWDALERAHILVTHAGLTVDAALVSVGLVKEEEE
jgi:hypothetical protein